MASEADSVVRVCSKSEVAPGSVKAFAVGDKTLAVYNIDGTFYATDDECTHAAASLADGMIEGDVIECCMHMGSFHIPTGMVMQPPCEVPLRTYQVVLKDEDFERVDLEATQTVDIQDFVDQEEIDPMFFYKPYYLEPQKGGDKAYTLLRDALKDSNKVGIAKVVIKTRQYLAGVKPEDGTLVLELMHFADELADPEKLHVPKKTEVGKREMNMAKSLIDSMSSKWNPEKYKDDYREALMEVIEEKVEAGGKEIEEKPKKAPKPTKVIDLVAVLQKSLEQTGGKKKATGKSGRKQKQPAEKAA